LDGGNDFVIRQSGFIIPRIYDKWRGGLIRFRDRRKAGKQNAKPQPCELKLPAILEHLQFFK
jgi:hypothetical protein